MGITLRNGPDEIGIKTVDKMGIDETGSHFFIKERTKKKTKQKNNKKHTHTHTQKKTTKKQKKTKKKKNNKNHLIHLTLSVLQTISDTCANITMFALLFWILTNILFAISECPKSVMEKSTS